MQQGKPSRERPVISLCHLSVSIIESFKHHWILADAETRALGEMKVSYLWNTYRPLTRSLLSCFQLQPISWTPINNTGLTSCDDDCIQLGETQKICCEQTGNRYTVAPEVQVGQSREKGLSSNIECWSSL